MAEANITIYLAAPRGFCAGVDRAIKIVAMALEKWGPPVYVRHDIVHNRYVVDDLRSKGAVFVEELDECPDDRPVIFSAHGVPKSVPAEADRRNLIYVDATCPLVSKVHIEAARHHGNGLQMIMVGHAGHPETLGTMGQLPEGEILLVETVEDVGHVEPRDPDKLAYITQTTLSVDDTEEIVAALKAPLPVDRWPAQGRHLLRRDKPPGCRQGNRAKDRRALRPGCTEFIEFEPLGRGRPNGRLQACPALAACQGHRLARDRGRAQHWSHGRRVGTRNPGERGARRLSGTVQRDGRSGGDRRRERRVQGAENSPGRCLTACRTRAGP